MCAYAITGGVKGAMLPVVGLPGANGMSSGGCYITGGDGGYEFRLPADVVGDVLIESTGGSFCSNESQVIAGGCIAPGVVMSLGSAVMAGVVQAQPGARSVLHVTPLSTAAVASAPANSLSATSFNSRFATIAAAVLGGTSNVTPATAPTLANQPYLAPLATALRSGASLASAVTTLAQGSTNFSGGTTAPGGGTGNPGAGKSPATVSAALVGTRTLVFRADDGPGCAGGKCTFAEGESVPVTVHADGRLTLPGKELANPFHRHLGAGPHLPEVIWLDTATNTEYALSDNSTGTFNEINVGDAAVPNAQGIPKFLGQLKTPSTGAPTNTVPAMTALSGTQTYTLLYASTQIGTDIRPATASFAPTTRTMTGYTAGDTEALAIGTMSNSEASGTTHLQIGRWNNGQFAGRYYSTVTSTTTLTLSANQGFNYVLAHPAPALPCGGRTTYSLAGATKPTFADGSAAPGTLDSLEVVAAFTASGAITFTGSGSLTIGGASYSFSGVSTVTPGPRRAFNMTMSTGTTASAYGVFAGPDAHELGLALTVSPAGGSAKTVRVAARLNMASTSAGRCS